jgi:hypothetical protein
MPQPHANHSLGAAPSPRYFLTAGSSTLDVNSPNGDTESSECMPPTFVIHATCNHKSQAIDLQLIDLSTNLCAYHAIVAMITTSSIEEEHP